MNPATCFALSAMVASVLDLTQPGSLEGWTAQHDLSPLSPSPEGITATVLGPDPYFAGPPLTAPAGVPLWLFLRWRSEAGGTFQVFYFRDHPAEERSVRGSVPAGAWTESRIPLPPLEPGTRLRIDPPGSSGSFTLAALRVEERPVLPAPAWPRPAPGVPLPGVEPLVSGSLSVQPAAAGWRVLAGEQPMAGAGGEVLAAYRQGTSAHWLSLRGGTPRREGSALVMTFAGRDEDGAAWNIAQRLTPEPRDGTVRVEATLEVSADRTVFAAPLLLLFPGLETFGAAKTQGLLAGLEYLEDEPGSSTADVEGPAARRRLPAPHKITFPLMAVTHAGHYIGLAWEPGPAVGPLFDSPARMFGTEAHAFGLVAMDAAAAGRDEGAFSADAPVAVRAGQPLTATAWIVTGRGDRATDAVRHVMALRGLPPVPDPGYDRRSYAAVAAAGWLDTKIREDTRFRHAVWPGFPPAMAADAPTHLLWLAGEMANEEVAGRLREAARAALAEIAPGERLARQIGHVKTWAPGLLSAPVRPELEAAARRARHELSRFSADGTVVYRPREGGPDYARTSPVPHASGLTAQAAAAALEAALFAAEPALLDEALARVRSLARYRGGVPRGAQTWEIPLHTPDILAAAHLVRAFALAYEVTRDRALLNQAVEWAWTGVPFVYLHGPTAGPVGPYSTIAVYGATSWKAPVWFGQPVQWCGLVYADALYLLARHDPEGPWKQLADGIAAAGLQHTWPPADRERSGLLPDFFLLAEQRRDGPAINPLTAGVCAARLFDAPPLADFRCVGRPRWRVFAPGVIEVVEENANAVRLRILGWPREPYTALLTGLTPDTVIESSGPREGDPADGWLALTLTGPTEVVIQDAPGGKGPD